MKEHSGEWVRHVERADKYATDNAEVREQNRKRMEGAYCKGSGLAPYPMPNNPVDPWSYLDER